MKSKIYYVYLIASESGTLYVGFTNNLIRRVVEHKEGLVDGFTKKYKCNRLVHFEEFENANEAINREKEIKKWRREKKENLIKILNPSWKDLFDDSI